MGGALGALPGFAATEVGQFTLAGLVSSVVLSFGSGEGLGGVFSKRGLDRALVFPMILLLAKNPGALWAVTDSGRATIGAFGGLALQTVASIIKNDLTPGFFDAEGLKEKLVCAFLGGVAAQASKEANLPGVVIPGFLAFATAFGGIPRFGREQHQ